MDNIKYSGNEIIINNKKIRFKYNIFKVKELSGKIFVLLDIPFDIEIGADELNNFFCFLPNGDLLWRIHKLDPKKYGSLELPYEDFFISNEKCSVFDFSGSNFTVNIDNGEVINKKFVK